MSFIEDEHGSKRRQLLSLLTAIAAFMKDTTGSKQQSCPRKPWLLLLWILFLLLNTKDFSFQLEDRGQIDSMVIIYQAITSLKMQESFWFPG